MLWLRVICVSKTHKMGLLKQIKTLLQILAYVIVQNNSLSVLHPAD